MGVGVYVWGGGPGWEQWAWEAFPRIGIRALSPSAPPSVEAVQPGPPMAPYSLPKEEAKWPPTLQPPVVLGPPAPDPSLLGPAPADSTAFGELLPEALPSLPPGPLAAGLPPAGEQLLPDLLISPHMLPRKNPRTGGPGRAGCSGAGGWFAKRLEGGEKRNKDAHASPSLGGGNKWESRESQ